MTGGLAAGDAPGTRGDSGRIAPPAAGEDLPRSPVLVLGVGNELFTDEGVGIVAAARLGERLAELGITGVDVVDGATLGLGLLPEIAEREAVLLLDAIASRAAAPGDVVVLIGDEVPYARSIQMSAHQVGVADALAAADLAGLGPRLLAAVGLVPVDLGTGVGLSPLASQRIDDIVGAALGVLAQWGVTAPPGLNEAGLNEAGLNVADVEVAADA